jgi:hypothetical protein
VPLLSVKWLAFAGLTVFIIKATIRLALNEPTPFALSRSKGLPLAK